MVIDQHATIYTTVHMFIAKSENTKMIYSQLMFMFICKTIFNKQQICKNRAKLYGPVFYIMRNVDELVKAILLSIRSQ